VLGALVIFLGLCDDLIVTTIVPKVWTLTGGARSCPHFWVPLFAVGDDFRGLSMKKKGVKGFI
jgi:hypothetical protein